jgi:hypothetical protein
MGYDGVVMSVNVLWDIVATRRRSHDGTIATIIKVTSPPTLNHQSGLHHFTKAYMQSNYRLLAAACVRR